MSHMCLDTFCKHSIFKACTGLDGLTFNQVVPGSNPGTLSENNPENLFLKDDFRDYFIWSAS